jgi:TolB-like protein
MKTIKILVLAVFAAGLAGASPASAASSLKSMAKRLAKGLKKQENRKVAVLSFPYHDGRVGPGSTIVQERLTTYLAETGRVEVIERALLEKVLGEMKLGASGAVDAATAQRLGRVLGAGAVVTGTLHDLPKNRTEVNARLVQTETAKILAARMARVERTWTGGPEHPNPAPVPAPTAGNLSQVALLLDTSSSMDGLIEQAKSQLWKIVNELADGEEKGERAAVEVALYEYGNSGLSARGGYIRRLTPFTRDLDAVSEALFSLRTNGGSEHAGQVIDRALSDLAWSRKRGVYRAVFIAGNESFGQGPVDYRAAVRRARDKGVFVNTIFCGPHQRGVASSWKDGAMLAGGDYFAIDQDRAVVAMRAPQDDEIERLGRELSDTYVPLGSYGKKAKARQRRAASAVRGLAAAGAAVDRAVFMAKPQYEASADWDAVARAERGDVVEAEELPAELRAMDEKERKKTLKEKAAKRARIQSRIRNLKEKRDSYLEKKRAESDAGKSLGAAVLDAVRTQRFR